MKAPRLHILILLLVATCLRTVCARDAAPAMVEEIAPATQVDTQLRINKTALLENQSVDAAIVLLLSENPEARAILLDVLSRADNPGARAAVCEALRLTRTSQQPIKGKEDFIKPLIAVITSEEDLATGKLAAEATLLFSYSQVQLELEKAVVDPSLSVTARSNVIHAMRRHPDKQAVIKLFNLMDSPEPQIAEAARNALAAVGIPVSTDPVVRRQMLMELQQRGTEAFLRERVIRQENRVGEFEKERESLWKKYLTAQTTLYNSQGTEALKVTFLATHLRDREARVKIWALDRLEELRVGTSKAKFTELELVLIALISDPSREVRLKTAKCLASLWELNVAKPLLDRLNVEADEQVRREILVALREACYASLTTPGPRIADEIRAGTLGWAVKFLNEADAEKARVGAEVIGKLLEPNGLKLDDISGHLTALASRYARMDPANDVGLRGYLLTAMAGLCSSRSACREQATKQFGALFEQALADKTDLVRQIAIDGLANGSDSKVNVLRKLRKDLGADPSLVIRVKLINLAEEAGTPQELDWLAEKLGVAGESDPAWQAMLKVFRRSPSTVLADWVAKIKTLAAAGKLTPEREIAFFATIEQNEQKAQTEANPILLRTAHVNLADLYTATGDLKRASEYLKVVLSAGMADQESVRLQGQLLRVYLELGSIDDACGLLNNYLLTKDLDLSVQGGLANCIDAYLSSATTVDPQAVLAAFRRIPVRDPQVLQAWQALLGEWTERYAKARKAEESDTANN